ncbi:MAG TPA: tetratricopeptide repeat protein [Kofleriaceae bacterium]
MVARLFLLLVVCFVAAPVRSAHADDPATRAARRHYERGEKLFALGKFDEALEEYQTAFDAKPLPGFLYNIGQCYRNLSDYDQAIFSFKKYLKLDPDAANKEAVERLIEELEEKKAQGDSQKFIKKPKKGEDKPVYKKWWFWTGVGVVAIGGSAAIYASGGGSSPPSTDLGNIVFGK